MDLRYRPAEPSDFEVCRRLLQGHLAYDPETLRSLPIVWRRLWSARAVRFAVTEDWEASPPQVVGFGATVFVTDEFMADARRGREPYLAARLIGLELAGSSPILRLPAVRQMNSGGGLNLIMMNYAESNRLPPEVRLAVRIKMIEAFFTDHRGYRLKEYVQEFWDEVELPYILHGWGWVRSDYSAYFRRRGKTVPPAGQRPYLVGATREEIITNPSLLTTLVFAHSPPRCFLNLGEQRLLERALYGETDVELAAALSIAVPTVKARWRAIYRRLAMAVPALVEDESGGESLDQRGKEKRRRVLEYVRQHPEELRPHVPTSRLAVSRTEHG